MVRGPYFATSVLLAVLSASPAGSQTPYGREPYNASADARADIQAALTRAQADGKLVLIEFGANWCGPCWTMAALLDRPKVRPFFAEHFHTVTVDIGRFNRNLDIVRNYGLVTSEGIPAAVVLAPDGHLIAVAKGETWGNIESVPAVLRQLRAWVERRPLDPIAAKGPRPTLDTAAMQSWTDSLRWDGEGGSLGTYVVDLRVDRDSVVSSLMLEQDGGLAQVIVTVHDPRTLAPREVRAASKGETVQLTYMPASVRGTRVLLHTQTSPGVIDTVRINLATDSATIDRRNLMIVVPRLALAPGKVFRLPVFDSQTMRTYAVRVACSKLTRIAMSGGEVDGYRVSLSGDMPSLPQTWYVSAAAPRRILRLSWPGAKLENRQ